MAVTSTIEYCTDRDLQDIMPSISEYDLKHRLYNFTKELDDWGSASGLDLYYSWNTGLVSQLFINGVEATKKELPTSADATTDGAQTENALAILVTANPTAFAAGDIIKVGDYYAKVSSITTNGFHSINITDGSNANTMFGTKSEVVSGSSPVYNALDATATNAPAGSIFLYDSDLDLLVLTVDSNQDPNDMIIEAGDDWSTIKTRFRRKSSRLIESHLDNRLSREVLKDREGNYPEIIVHVTALQTVILLLKAHDPNSELIAPFQDELNELIDGLKAGTIVLPTSISGDSSKGVIREVSVDSASDLRPIELRGHYNGIGYELLKVYIDSGEGGIIGTTKMSVYGKNSTLLKTDTLIDSEVITGDFQHLGVGSLYIRWSGDDCVTAITTAADEYEIELWGSSLDTTISSVGSMRMTRS